MSDYKYGISIVMPCLNESRTVGICIEKALKSIEKSGLPGEVIVADNGSVDGSREIAEQKGAIVVPVSEKGYGSALRGGIKAASYNYVIMGDADDSYDFSNVQEFIDKLEQGYELVMGNRFAGGIASGAMPFSHRYIGNPILSGLGRVFFGTEIRDFHCGLRAFRKSSVESLGLCTSGMEFASEMVVKAVLFKLEITEVPCKLYPDGRDRPPHLRSIPDGFRHLEFLLVYSPKWLFAYPGVLLTLIGLFFTVLIFIRPLQIGRVQFEVTTMLYSALAMLIGFQMIQFSVFTVEFGRRIGQLPEEGGFADKLSDLVRNKGYWIALILLAAGAVGVIFTLVRWAGTGFGELNTTRICRTAILFGSLFAMGIEMLLFTIFARILRMGGTHDSK